MIIQNLPKIFFLQRKKLWIYSRLLIFILRNKGCTEDWRIPISQNEIEGFVLSFTIDMHLLIKVNVGISLFSETLFLLVMGFIPTICINWITLLNGVDSGLSGLSNFDHGVPTLESQYDWCAPVVTFLDKNC